MVLLRTHHRQGYVLVYEHQLGGDTQALPARRQGPVVVLTGPVRTSSEDLRRPAHTQRGPLIGEDRGEDLCRASQLRLTEDGCGSNPHTPEVMR